MPWLKAILKLRPLLVNSRSSEPLPSKSAASTSCQPDARPKADSAIRLLPLMYQEDTLACTWLKNIRSERPSLFASRPRSSSRVATGAGSTTFVARKPDTTGKVRLRLRSLSAMLAMPDTCPPQKLMRGLENTRQICWPVSPYAMTVWKFPMLVL